MSQIEITAVLSKADRDAFLKFPWEIYANDPAWVPPLLIERKEFLDRKKHPFYQHGDAALFLARRHGKIVGRIMASDDPNYNALHQSSVGCFGLFESINDRAVAEALLEGAAKWLRAKGRTEVMGPIDYSTNYVCGLLIDGFEHPPTILTSHNPPYYAELLEQCGFAKTMDFFAWWFADPSYAVSRLQRFARALQKRHKITIRQANFKNFAAESERLRLIYNEAWQNNWGYVPFTKSEFDFMAKELKPILLPEWALIAEVNGEPAGFMLAVPDINVAIKHANGRLTRFGIPIGLAKILYHKSRIKKARFIALGVVSKHRRHGVAELLVLQSMEDGMVKQGFSSELSMTLENNHLVNRFIEGIGAKKYKTFRIYQRSIA